MFDRSRRLKKERAGNMNPWKKILSTINKWSIKIEILWKRKHYVQSVLTLFVPPLVLGVGISMLICVMDNVINFLRFNYPKLIFAGLLLWCFIAWWDDHKAKQQKFRQLEREEEEREEYRARMDYGSTKDATYIEEGKILFDVSKELGGLGIVPPMRLSDIYSPSRTIPKINGAFFFCLFLLQKDREVVDTELIRHTLQTKIDQRLTAGEYPGVDAKYTYKGRTYSGWKRQNPNT